MSKAAFYLLAATFLVVLAWGREPASANFALLRIENPASDKVVELSLEDMKRLEWQTLRTVTPWTQGETVFGGVPLETLLAGAGIVSGPVQAIALNDYQSSVDLADAVSWEAFVACEADGAPISVREKGPCWIVYPWSDRPELDNGYVQAFSVWQLHTLRAQ